MSKILSFALVLYVALLNVSTAIGGICPIFNYLSCTKLSLVGCCKICRRGCCCINIRVWLPTAAVYAVPESVYSKSPQSGFASAAYAKGNAKIVTFDANKVLRLFGLTPCKGGCRLIGASVSKYDSHSDSQWSTTDGILRFLNELNWQQLPSLLGTKVEDRLFASTLIFATRAINRASSNLSGLRLSVSPFTNSCVSPEPDAFSLLKDASSQLSEVYANYGSFLNKMQTEPFDAFERKAFDLLTSASCSDSVVGFDKHPVYYIWQKYKCCIRN